MRIIQSFAQFKEGSPYANHKNVYLNFYSFLLSYLTLNKYYGHVTMVCNEDAYNSFIRYIPYDEIILLENNNNFDFWSVYKIDALKLIDGDVIHVDSDVFIFDDLFREFIDGNYDILAQDCSKWNGIAMSDFVNNNSNFLKANKIIDAKIYDNGFTSCGTLGLKNHVKPLYYDAVDKIYEGMKNDEIICTYNKNEIKHFKPVVLEELTMYLVGLSNGYKISTILDGDLMREIGYNLEGCNKKYTHMWFDSRFETRNIDLMKRKIRNEFPYYRKLIDKYEVEVMKY